MTFATTVSLALMSLVVSACDPPPCEQPYPTVWAYFQPASGPPPPEPSPVEGTPRPEPTTPPFDTDGDGVVDTLDTEGSSVVVHRSRGDLVLQAAGEVALATFWTPSDADADGLSDLFIRVDDGADGTTRYYWVPGATPDGTWDPAAAGVRLFGNGAVLTGWARLGDVDGDGADDVGIYSTADQGLEVWSGATVASAGPGGTDTSEPVVYPGLLRARWQTESGALAFAMIDDAVDEVVVHTPEDTTRYTTVGSGVELRAIEYSSLRLVDGDEGQTWLALEIGERLGISSWAWDVDDPCAAPTTTTQSS